MSMPQKNQIIELEITGISSEGLGVGRSSGMVVFVNGAVTGDKVLCKITKVQKSHCFGIVDKILISSEYRGDVDCPVFPQCGGCRLRHVSYEFELENKYNWVSENLKRIGESQFPLLDIIPSPKTERYRNKAQYPVGIIDGKVVTGFYASRSHRLIRVEDCLLQPKVFGEISEVICSFISKNEISIYDETTGKGLIRHICFRSSEGEAEVMVTIVVNGKTLPKSDELVLELTSRFANIKVITLSFNTKKTNVVWGSSGKILFGSGTITDQLAGVMLELSADSFYQINKEATELLYKKVAEYAAPTSGEIILDLYCGIGSIGLSLAKYAGQIIGVEIVQAAVENAVENAKKNGIVNARFICSDAGKAAERLAVENLLPDTIIIDPPRKGIDQLTAESIVKMNPKKIIYVSCNSATLARDLKLFAAEGYTATHGIVVDMFPRTVHVETVVLLEK